MTFEYTDGWSSNVSQEKVTEYSAELTMAMEAGITFKGIFEAKRSISATLAASVKDTITESMTLTGSAKKTLTCTPDPGNGLVA